MSRAVDELLAIMARLRAADGCPWDREQTFATIAPYTIEEAYEVAAAIERGDWQNLQDELGDLLLQVAFHAQMASEANLFDFEAVAAGIGRKLMRRHPHIFAGGADTRENPRSAAEQTALWENIKAEERQAAQRSQMDGVPESLPALMRAHKLSTRAARTGFDFEIAGQAADKVQEELAEVRAAVAAGQGGKATPEVFEEVGDLLFAAANLARKLHVDAEAALRAANAKFEKRFRGMEALAAREGGDLGRLDLAAQERLWQEMKRGE